MRFFALVVTCSLLVACAGKVDYVRPNSPATSSNMKVVNKPRDAVWAQVVPELGKRFFVINNLDKSSGLINLSYSGNPERYIDCGRVTSVVKNAAGERTYNFNGAVAETRYETMSQQGLFRYHRKMALEGRVNLVFEEISPTQTRVTASTRYGLQRSQQTWNAMNQPLGASTDSVSMNTGGSGSFPPNASGATLDCVPTGELEQEILSTVYQ